MGYQTWFGAFWTFHSPQENVVDLLPDEGPQPQELSINPMQDGLQEVPFSWVLTVEQLQQLEEQARNTHARSEQCIQGFFFFQMNQ